MRHPQMLPLLRGVHCLYTRIMVPQGGAEPSVSCRPAPASRRQFVRSCRRLYFLPFNRGQVSFSSTQRCRGYVPFVMTVHFEKAVGSRMPSPLLPGKRHAALRLFTYKRARSGGVCRRLFAVPVGRGRPALAWDGLPAVFRGYRAEHPAKECAAFRWVYAILKKEGGKKSRRKEGKPQ